MRSALGLFCLALIGCGASGRPSHGGQPAADRVARFRSWEHVTHGYGVDRLTEDQALGRWHWILRFRGDEVVEAQEISPNGAKFRRRALSHDASGALTVLEFDVHGVQRAVRTVDADGRELVVFRSGVVGEGCHHRKLVADARGLRSESICYDEANRPLAADDGCERTVYELNDRGHVTRGACLRADGTRATFEGGHHEYRTIVDDIGSELETVFLDLDGQPKATGCARETNGYARNGLSARRRCTTRTGAFESEMRWQHDDNGCRTEYLHVDAAGKPRLDNGVAAYVLAYNAQCEELRRETRGINGELVGEPAVREKARDGFGRETELRCRDAKLAPVSCLGASTAEGAMIKYTYDDRDRQVSKRCYTMDAAPSRCSAEYPFEERVEYDSRGREIAQSFFDAAGNPALALGAARIVLAYDAVGNIASQRYFGVHKEPVLSQLGCHEMRNLRDDHHQLAAVECRGKSLELTEINGGCLNGACFVKGAARVVVERPTTTKLFNVHYDANGKELGRVSCDVAVCFR